MKIQISFILRIFLFYLSSGAYASDVGSLIESIGQNSVFTIPQTAMEMNQLISLGEPAVDEIVEKLNNPKTPIQQQWNLTFVLGKIGSSKAIPGLINNLKTTDNDWQRGEVYSALLEIGEQSINSLIIIVKDELSNINSTEIVRHPAAYAARALGYLGAKQASEDIRTLLQNEYNFSLNRNGRWGATPYIKQMLMDALILLGDLDSVPLIEEMIKNDIDVNNGIAQKSKERFNFLANGKNPFEIYKPLNYKDPKRVYISSYTGGTRVDRDAENGALVNYEVIPAGSTSK